MGHQEEQGSKNTRVEDTLIGDCVVLFSHSEFQQHIKSSLLEVLFFFFFGDIG